jgi:tetratricopeptide (TPR) repeat protein
LTIALLYLLGRMPEADEEAYEIHLLECRSCLARAEAVEHALRYRSSFQGEVRDMRELRRRLFPLVVLFLGLAAAAPAAAQFGSPLGDRGPTNDTFGGNYKDPQQKAADHLAKGLRLKDKADKETDARKKANLLEKAKAEFQSSNALHPNHDALVALGLLALGEGNRKAAMDACWQALGLRKDSRAAQDCFEQAKALPVTAPNPQRPGSP